MKQFSIRILVLLLFLAGTFMAQAQTGGYSFAQSTETFTVPTTGLVGSDGLPSTSPMPFPAVWDDSARIITLPFPIAVKNQIFTSVTVSPNGYINFGTNYLYGFVADLYPRVNSTFTATRSLGSNQLVSVSSMTGLKTGMRISGSGITDGTIITAISGSTVTMSSNATASGNFSVMSDSGIYCTVSGTAPNRIFTVVYRDVTFFSGTNDVMDFKIEVGESNGLIKYVYGAMSIVTSRLLSVGITNFTDYHFRATNANWASTTYAVFDSQMTLSPSVKPASGLAYTFTPICISPAPTASPSQTFCAPATIADLQATSAGTTQWYSANSGGAPLASNVSLINGTTYYAGQQLSGCSPSLRTAVNVTVNTPVTYYADADNDGFGDFNQSVSSCTTPLNHVTTYGDCDDSNTLFQDLDNDGFGSTIKVACNGVLNATDCDDSVPANDTNILGSNRTVTLNNAICNGSDLMLESNLSSSVYSFEWKRNGNTLPGETSSSLLVTEAGSYSFIYSLIDQSCAPQTDLITVEFYPQIITPNPVDLYVCSNLTSTYTYNLAQNTAVVSNGITPAPVVSYHNSQADADNDSNSLPLNYSTTGNETIYVRIENANQCYITKSFQLLSSPSPTATQPQDLQACTQSSIAVFFLPQQTSVILNGQPTSLFAVTYHTSSAGANNNTNIITNPNSYMAVNMTTIYARVRNISNPSCYAVTSFQLLVNPSPPVDELSDVTICGSYELPVLSNGGYFSELNGGGTQFFPGDLITGSTTLYVYNHPDAPEGCASASSFNITITEPPVYYADNDGDGFGDINSTQSSCIGIPTGFVDNSSDCNDGMLTYLDADGDGFGSTILAPCGVSSNSDCDDNDQNVFISAAIYVDADNDGYTSGETEIVCHGTTAPAGYALENIGIDCNDDIAAINPGKTEVLYNGIDDNCDGEFDEGNQFTTQIVNNQCGTTVVGLNTLVAATPKTGGTAYRFEVTNTATNHVQTIIRPQPYFNFSQLSQYDYATTYSIRVEVQRYGIWLGYYGTSCLVSTPAILSANGAAQISPTLCGSTIASVNTLIATASLPGVTGYKFRITNLTNPAAPNQVQVLDRGHISYFKLSMLSNFNYGATYLVEVAVKTTGSYSTYGNPCMITAPAVPTLTNCGATITAPNSLVATASLQYITAYRFEITSFSNNSVVTLDRPTAWFTFNQVPNYVPGGFYGVRIAVMTKGVFSEFGEACEITAPGASAREIEEIAAAGPIFSATAYPNPFADDFRIKVDSSNADPVNITIYDMTGRLLETRKIAVEDIKSTALGTTYPAGVYNVIVTHGDNVKTLRVIKR